MTPSPLRIGILGAANIAPNAIIHPARQVPDAQIVAIAARDPARARAFAARHGISQVHESYAALIADPNLDAIYNPLPNSLHAEWSIRALQAGKHVLCEKPIASNAEEARQMAQAAQTSGCLLIEAFHNLYHPLATRMKTILASGEIGQIQRIEGHFCILLRRWNDIRYHYHLAGGALMDLGCYPLRLMRYLIGAPPQVERARSICRAPHVDRWLDADLRWDQPGGTITGRMTCAFYSTSLFRISLKVVGDAGEMQVINPVLPHLWNRLRVKGRKGEYRERVAGESTYTYQLRAFVEAVRGSQPMFTDAEDGVVSMEVIDAVYRKAGLRLRGDSERRT